MSGVLNVRLLVVFVIVTAAFAITTTGVLANGRIEVPGWGHGDKNHTHAGPPGQSVSVNPRYANQVIR